MSLQDLRKSNGFTQYDIAELLNINRASVSKWETGVSIPNIEHLKKLSELYKLTINELLDKLASLKLDEA